MTHPERPLRSDARRNRDRLLQAALQAFSAEPSDEVTLERVARDAGVGIGTLYRHFPTRETLIEEVYRAELTRLCDSAPRLLADLPPDAALRTWMDGFIDYSATKRGLAEALRAVIAAGGRPFAQSRDRMTTALAELLTAGEAVGLRTDVDPYDVLVALSAVSLWVSEPDRREQGARVLDLLMDGLRYKP